MFIRLWGFDGWSSLLCSKCFPGWRLDPRFLDDADNGENVGNTSKIVISCRDHEIGISNDEAGGRYTIYYIYTIRYIASSSVLSFSALFFMQYNGFRFGIVFFFVPLPAHIYARSPSSWYILPYGSFTSTMSPPRCYLSF